SSDPPAAYEYPHHRMHVTRNAGRPIAAAMRRIAWPVPRLAVASAHRKGTGRGPGSPIVSTVRTRSEDTRRLIVESVALGLGYACVLIWGGSALVAAFSSNESYPYWPGIPLRTDTSGVLAFAVSAVSLTVSRYLELRRRERRAGTPAVQAVRPAGVLAVQAVAEAAVVCATGLVIYLSLNAVVHPWTLQLQLTHLWPWPSEGTVRVI